MASSGTARAVSTSWVALVNARARRASSSRARRRLRLLLERELGADVLFTEHRGHATELARSAGSGAIAVFGGDGTVSEVVNGMDLTRQAMLVLPGGTGNGLARDLHLTSVSKALAAGRRGRVEPIDLVRVTFRVEDRWRARLMISTASVGYVAELVAWANQHLGYLHASRYPVAATVRAFPQIPFRVSVTGESGPSRTRDVTNVLVNNTAHSGNSRPFPGSSLTDGRFEVAIARANGFSQLLHNAAILSQTYVYRTATEVPVSAFSVSVAEPRALMVDGEIWSGVREARFEILPQALRCYT